MTDLVSSTGWIIDGAGTAGNLDIVGISKHSPITVSRRQRSIEIKQIRPLCHKTILGRSCNLLCHLKPKAALCKRAFIDAQDSGGQCNG